MEEEKNKKDIVWLLHCMNNSAPDMKFLEPTIQSLSLIYATKNEPIFTHEDLIKMSLSGFIAMRARMVDESRFSDVHPFLYYQAAQLLMEKDYSIGVDNEEEFNKFIEKIKS
jgi:hypothetical protein